jgi:hypothetical protein
MVCLHRIGGGRRAHRGRAHRGTYKSLSLLVVIVHVLLLIGALPTWGYSRSWGYRPVGGLGLIVVIVLVLWLLGVF